MLFRHYVTVLVSASAISMLIAPFSLLQNSSFPWTWIDSAYAADVSQNTNGLGAGGSQLGAGASGFPQNITPSSKNGYSTSIGSQSLNESGNQLAKDQVMDLTPKAALKEPSSETENTLEPTLLAVAAAASSDESIKNAPKKSSIPDVPGTGHMAHKIGIIIPDYRGLEPKIELNYNSSRKTKISGTYQGWLGLGWGLDGFDVIERASVGYGLPAFDASDVFQLNGEVLVTCGVGVVSPSCATGGSHATEIESFNRIKFDTNANEWVVTNREGIASTFKSVQAYTGATPVAGTADFDLQRNYRWLLASVTDTNGNSVTYNYTCLAAPVCYPSTIIYNGSEISFYYDIRPDYILMANGRTISSTTKRVKSIAVRTSGVLGAAYVLSYDQAPFSNATRLTQVNLYGKTAAVDANGTVTRSDNKIIRKMLYDNVNYSYTQKTGIFPNSPLTGLPSEVFTGSVSDLNYDGREELSKLMGSTSYNWRIYSFNNDGSVKSSSYIDIPKKASVQDVPYVGPIFFNTGRFNKNKNAADKPYIYVTAKEDRNGFINYTSSTHSINLDSQLVPSISNCSNDPACTGLGGAWYNNYSHLVLDSNGDGVDETRLTRDMTGKPNQNIIGVADLRGNGRMSGLYSDGDPSDQYLVVIDIKNGAPVRKNYQQIKCFINCALADLNGDGATDIIQLTGNTPRIMLSTGNGFMELQPSLGSLPSGLRLRDFDNDGKVDFVQKDGSTDSSKPQETKPIYAWAFWFSPTGNQLVKSPLIGNGNGLYQISLIRTCDLKCPFSHSD